MKMSGGDKMQKALNEILKKAKSSNALEVGFMEGATEEDGTPTAMVAAMNEFGHTVPGGSYYVMPRPFFRNMINDGSKHWAKDLGKLLKANHYDAPRALDQLGLLMEAELVKSINDLWSPPLAHSTIARKGFEKPLVDTGDMWKSISHVVR